MSELLQKETLTSVESSERRAIGATNGENGRKLPGCTAPVNSLDQLFCIRCGPCGESSPATDWKETPISGELPEQDYQCPKCRYAFRRQKNPEQWGPAYVLVQIPARL